jgi:hypothetical protein
MVRPTSLGSGEVHHTNRPIIHFGSPVGAQYVPPVPVKPTTPDPPAP